MKTGIKEKWPFLFIVVLFISTVLFEACKHEPILPSEPPGATGSTGVSGATGSTGLTGPTGNRCDPDSVYFFKDVLPILQSNCALSGCHDDITKYDGVILDSYDNAILTGKIKAGRPADSEIYEVLVETDPDKIMPPPPASPLSQNQIETIRKWIEQGAKDLKCNPNFGKCDTMNVSFSTTIFPVINNSCVGCHRGANPGGGIQIEDYSDVKVLADNGKLLGVISWQPGFKPMPDGGAMLDSCYITKLNAWINQGAKNN